MNLSVTLINWFLRRVFQTICRIDLPEIEKVPCQGPLILVGNHVNFLEAPVLLPHINSPWMTAIAKRESWNNPLLHFLFNQWKIIPIDRELIDREAFRQSIKALEEGKVLAVFPEGTRSKDGRLLQGKPGVVALALRSQAPLVPVVCYGHEGFWKNLKSFRRTDFHVAVGKPFRVISGAASQARENRQAVADEIMYKMAELLPEKYRGLYQNLNGFQYKFLVGA